MQINFYVAVLPLLWSLKIVNVIMALSVIGNFTLTFVRLDLTTRIVYSFQSQTYSSTKIYVSKTA